VRAARIDFHPATTLRHDTDTGERPRMTSRIHPIEREVAGTPPISSWTPADATYQAILTEEAAARSSEGVYAVFQDMEDRDAHLFATLQTRKNALLGCPWQLTWSPLQMDAVGSRRRDEIASCVQRVLDGVPDFIDSLHALLDAFAKGYAVAEILWRVDPKTGVVGIERIVARRQSEFAFGSEGSLCRLEQALFPAAHSEKALPPDTLLRRPGEIFFPCGSARRMPDRKFLVFVFQPAARSPYGTPLCAKAYWYSWLKRRAMSDWATFNEKYGSPTPLARYAPTTAPEDIVRLAESLEKLRDNSGLVIPETISVELLEARRNASGASCFRELADWCNDEISKIILGQTLTTSEGRRSGSLALGRVHEAVKHEYLTADARAFGCALSTQLVRWIVDFNFGVGVPAPQLVFEVEDAIDYKSELEVDRGLIQLGVALDPDYFYARYRRPVPAPDARKLKYDDANLYQYHLQYGILTVNEVRAALGLPPVAWGNKPPVRSGPNQSAEADATVRKEPIVDSLESHDDTLGH
jgi:phage gp29-like protein